MSRPQLLYVIGGSAPRWTVRCEDQQYGPYGTREAAERAATAEAAAAGRAGLTSVILSHANSNGAPRRWDRPDDGARPEPLTFDRF